MAGRDAYDWEQEGLDPDGPSAADLERFGGETRSCPACGAEVWDQAERCHSCDAWVVPREEDPLSARSKVGLMIGLVILAMGGAALLL